MNCLQMLIIVAQLFYTRYNALVLNADAAIHYPMELINIHIYMIFCALRSNAPRLSKTVTFSFQDNRRALGAEPEV